METKRQLDTNKKYEAFLKTVKENSDKGISLLKLCKENRLASSAYKAIQTCGYAKVLGRNNGYHCPLKSIEPIYGRILAQETAKIIANWLSKSHKKHEMKPPVGDFLSQPKLPTKEVVVPKKIFSVSIIFLRNTDDGKAINWQMYGRTFSCNNEHEAVGLAFQDAMALAKDGFRAFSYKSWEFNPEEQK